MTKKDLSKEIEDHRRGILVKTNQSCLKINQELGNEMVRLVREELSRVSKPQSVPCRRQDITIDLAQDDRITVTIHLPKEIIEEIIRRELRQGW